MVTWITLVCSWTEWDGLLQSNPCSQCCYAFLANNSCKNISCSRDQKTGNSSPSLLRQWLYYSVNYSSLQPLAGFPSTPVNPSCFAAQIKIREIPNVSIQAWPMVWHFPEEREMETKSLPKGRAGQKLLLLPWWMFLPQVMIKKVGNIITSVFSAILEISKPGKPGSLAILCVSLCLPLKLLKTWSLNFRSTATNAKDVCKHFKNSAEQSKGTCRVKGVCGLKRLLPVCSKVSTVADPQCLSVLMI